MKILDFIINIIYDNVIINNYEKKGKDIARKNDVEQGKLMKYLLGCYAVYFNGKYNHQSEDADEKVGKYLRKNHPEYQKIKKQIKEIMKQNPNVQAVFTTDKGISLSSEEHEVLNHYFNLESIAELIEREYPDAS